MQFSPRQATANLTVGDLLPLYRSMMRIRMVEEAIAEHYAEGEMRCPVHLSIGQEAIAVGVCAALRRTDRVYSTHRCHAHYLAKGGDLKAMLAEIWGKQSGCIGGRGGSMHLMDPSVGMIASIPIVSSAIPVAVGSALAAKRASTDVVTVVFIGDASIEEGVFHESANFASLHALPVVFVCENNLYSVYTRLSMRQPDRPLTAVGEAHGIPSIHGDGNDIGQCYALAQEAVDRARSGGGPTLLVLDSYRWREHCGPNYDNNIGYRSEDEFKTWADQCPIRRLETHLGSEIDARRTEMAREITAEIEAAMNFARADELPKPEHAPLHVYA